MPVGSAGGVFATFALLSSLEREGNVCSVGRVEKDGLGVSGGCIRRMCKGWEAAALCEVNANGGVMGGSIAFIAVELRCYAYHHDTKYVHDLSSRILPHAKTSLLDVSIQAGRQT